MESRRKRSRSQIIKWVCYTLLMLLCTVLQTTPGLFQLGDAKPLWLLPLALAVAVEEDEFAGGIFGAVCGLMWDYTAGRTVGMLAFELLVLCFLLSAVVQLYFKASAANFVLLALGQVCWCSRWTGCSSTTCPATAGRWSGICGSCCPRRCSPSRSVRWCSGVCAASMRNSRSTTA